MAVAHGHEGTEQGFWARIVPSHITGAILAAVGWIAGNYFTNMLAPDLSNYADYSAAIGFTCMVIGWLLGVGALDLPIRWALGKDPSPEQTESLSYHNQGTWRYFRWNTDHKVIGVQYLVFTLFMLSVGGLLAMLMRTELMFPGAKFVDTATYNTFVTMHGMLMIATMFSIIVGPFGNFILPIMIGARDMAFPRLNALSWHLLFIGVVIFLFMPFLGGDQTGWTNYAPLADQTEPSATAFQFGVLIIMLSSGVGAINIITTILTMRAPGMTWTRMPIFVWGILASTILTATATTSINADLIEVLLDRGWNTSFFLNTAPFVATSVGGGQAWLAENLFWFFGHPEVYLIALPGFGAVMEVATVFSRKPLFIYKLSVVGIMGVAAVSFLVWGHHLFVSGWQNDLRGYYMGTTELISIPTGFVFLGLIGTMWRGKIWMTVAMGWVFAFLWTFMIGGITGIYLSDVPLDIQLHGNFFVTGHFHYVILGSALFGFFAAVYYWFPKMTGRMLDETLGWIHFWWVNISFNVTFCALFYVGLQGMPRRVADYSPLFAVGNFVASIGAYVLGAGMLVFFANVMYSWVAGRVATANPWDSKSLEWATPTPVPVENFEHIPVVVRDPYGYGMPAATPVVQSSAGM